MLRLQLIVSLMLIALSLPACDDTGQSHAPTAASPAPTAGGNAVPQGDAAQAAEADKQCAADLAEAGKTAEARDWLAPSHDNHALWKGDKARTRKLVDDIYAAGAPAVTAVGMEKMNDTEIVAMFVVTLPTAPAARAAVFNVVNAFWKEIEADEELVHDLKQKYLMVNLDL